MKPSDIRLIRKTYGETQEEFGKRFFVGTKQVSHWETGYRQPKGQKLEALEEMLKRLTK
jgi:DNA-binding transcriptional regulator YiaG